MGALITITTVPDSALAVKLADHLLAQHLAACVHVLPMGQSFYRWQGKIESRNEITLLIKTVDERYPEVESAIKAMHPYALPEIIALPINKGLPEYLNWIAMETV